MRALVALVLASALLAGCSDQPPAATDDVPPTSMTGSDTPLTAPAAPKTEILPVDFDGSLGTILHGCIFPVGLCPTHTVTPESSDLFIERPGANLTGLDVVITWTAQTPATATLAFGAMVMGDCEACDVEFAEPEGPSPIRIQVDGLALPLNETVRIHIYAYNPQGIVTNPSVPGYVVASAEQAFHIEGTATFLVPPA